MMILSSKLSQLLTANKVLLENAASLIGTLGATSGLGFAYWWLAAKMFDQVEVGLASALISAMMLLGTISMMGMGTLLIGELSRNHLIVAALITSGLIISGVAAMIAGLIFAVIAGTLSSEFSVLIQDISNTLLFTGGVILTGVLMVLDQALLGLLRGNLQFFRNVVFAASKLVVLLLVGLLYTHVSGMTIYATWFMGNILSIVPLLFYTQRKPLKSYYPVWGIFKKLSKSAVAHHILNLSLQTSQFAMPVVVTVMFSSEINASFYVAWLIAGFVFVVPTALTQTLYAISSKDTSMLAQKIRFTLKLSFLAELAGVILIILTANLILKFFGGNYADTATTSLQILPLAAFPIIIRVHYVAIAQVHRQLKTAASLTLVSAALELIMAILGGSLGGLAGLSLGWVLAIVIQAIVMSPTVYRISAKPMASSAPARA